MRNQQQNMLPHRLYADLVAVLLGKLTHPGFKGFGLTTGKQVKLWGGVDDRSGLGVIGYPQAVSRHQGLCVRNARPKHPYAAFGAVFDPSNIGHRTGHRNGLCSHGGPRLPDAAGNPFPLFFRSSPAGVRGGNLRLGFVASGSESSIGVRNPHAAYLTRNPTCLQM